mgnify:FL=1
MILRVKVSMDGQAGWALVDSGCSVSLVAETMAKRGRELRGGKMLQLQMANGRILETCRRIQFKAVSCDGVELGAVEAYVVPRLPTGVDMIVGLPVISRMGCWIGEINGVLSIRFGAAKNPSYVAATMSVGVESGKLAKAPDERNRYAKLEIEDDDFKAWLSNGIWNIAWKWREGANPVGRGRSGYRVKEEVIEEFDAEIAEWINDGILERWEERKHGAVMHRLPIMAIVQSKGGREKVRPVCDFRQLNDVIESRPGGATPMCPQRVREWRMRGSKFAVVDLRRAYLQVRVDPSLWCFQAVEWHGKTYVLTRLGFGLNIAPKVMTAIVEAVLRCNEQIASAASSYIDDIFVDESLVDAASVVEHLQRYGLSAKEPERLGNSDGVRVLGMRVRNDFTWQRDGELCLDPVLQLTRREVHHKIGAWLGHYPVASWLRVCGAFLQRCTAQEKQPWGAMVSTEVLDKVRYVQNRMSVEGDPVRGVWPVNPRCHVVLWTDASSLAIGVTIEVDGKCVEDACWLRKPEESSHINVAELEAVIKGINLMSKWRFRVFTVACDSSTVCGWLRSVCDRSHNVRSHSLCELLIKRRLDILKEVIAQENLTITVRQVKSEENRADVLTRVPKDWLKCVVSNPCVAIASETRISVKRLRALHGIHHFGVDRSLELARSKFGNGVSRRLVQKVVKQCDTCAKFDPSIRDRWSKGRVSSSITWQRLAADITHVGGTPWLTVIDCASRFTIWKSLTKECAREVMEHLLAIFGTMGPPNQLLTDNGTVFRSNLLVSLLSEWNVEAVLSGAYRPQGNGLVERVHRTIKRMVSRTKSSVPTCVFWYNVTRGSRVGSPFELVFSAIPKMPGICKNRIEISRPDNDICDFNTRFKVLFK